MDPVSTARSSAIRRFAEGIICLSVFMDTIDVEGFSCRPPDQSASNFGFPLPHFTVQGLYKPPSNKTTSDFTDQESIPNGVLGSGRYPFQIQPGFHEYANSILISSGIGCILEPRHDWNTKE